MTRRRSPHVKQGSNKPTEAEHSAVDLGWKPKEGEEIKFWWKDLRPDDSHWYRGIVIGRDRYGGIQIRDSQGIHYGDVWDDECFPCLGTPDDAGTS